LTAASSEDLAGKAASDLQTGIVIGTNTITGTLKPVTNYTGFSDNTDLQNGYYLALDFSNTSPSDATIVVKLSSDVAGTTLDSDRLIVEYIEPLSSETTTKTLTVTITKPEYPTVTQTYNLSGLVLSTE